MYLSFSLVCFVCIIESFRLEESDWREGQR